MAQSTDQADDQGPAADVPYGPLKGKANLHPRYGSLGKNRPLGPGEFVASPDGGWESEMTYSPPYQGKFAVLPGLWLLNGVPTHVEEDQAIELAQASGLNWPMFDTQDAANDWAKAREDIWEKTPFGRSDAQAPLWSRPWPPNTGPGRQ
jgi:hypothetical protein